MKAYKFIIFLVFSLTVSMSAYAAGDIVADATVTPISTEESIVEVTDVKLIYDGNYSENVLLPGKTLEAEVNILNSTEASKQMVSHIVQYDTSGKFSNISSADTIDIAAQQSASINASQTFAENYNGTASIIAIEKSESNILYSYRVSTAWKDTFGDNFDEAYESDLDHGIMGKINSNEDVDVIKFTASHQSVCSINLQSEANVTYDIYSSSQELISGNNATYQFTGGETYYLSINGDTNSEYIISLDAADYDDIVTKNVGVLAQITSEKTSNTFLFVPEDNGKTSTKYRVTTVGASNLVANLYNSSGVKIAESTLEGDSAGYAVTAELEPNKSYFIEVLPENENTSATYSYTLFVEEYPFNIINIRTGSF